MFAIKIENISKCFRLYRHPRDRLLEILFRKPRHEQFWALKDISFEIVQGETFGIIGDNGAGKSTLLKIIAGTLTPSSGKIEIKGRVAALLELGAGFHPELTGRQNIYLNASLLGLSEEEIKEREKDIISFAELEQFIDQPVKTYSSGMYVRLAFAIAVQVNPDILIVDEALSVGDQRFQKKSIDRIMEFRNQGKTILFCSHSLYHVTHLCQRALWLHQGQICEIGEARYVVQAYEDWSRNKEKKLALNSSETWLGKVFISLDNKQSNYIEPFQTLRIKISFEAPGPCHIAIGFKRNDNVQVFVTSTQLDQLSPLPPKGSINFVFDSFPLLSGIYSIDVALLDETGNIVYARSSEEIKVLKNHEELGIVYLPHEWAWET